MERSVILAIILIAIIGYKYLGKLSLFVLILSLIYLIFQKHINNLINKNREGLENNFKLFPENPTYSWDFRVDENVGVKDKYNNIVAKYENGLESNKNDGTIFNGNNNVIKVGENQTINLGGKNKGRFSVEMYIYINKLDSNIQYELLRLADANDRHLHIGINGNWGGIGPKYSISFTGSTEPNRDIPVEYIGLGTPKAGEWLHIVWSSNVVDSVRSSVMSLYVNTTQHNHGWGGNRYNPELMKSISAISNTFGAGKNNRGALNGKIGYIRIWDGYALTASDVTDLYNNRENRMAYYNPNNFSLSKPKLETKKTLDIKPVYSNFEKFTFNNTNKELSDSDNLKLTDKFTVMAWVKQKEMSNDWVRVIGKGDATNRNYGIWIQGKSNTLLSQVYPISKGVNVWPEDNILESNTWTHLAMTFHKDKKHKLYKNGKLIKEEETQGTPPTNDDPLTIGGAEIHNKLIGEITAAVVLDKVLNEDDIKKFAESPDKNLNEILGTTPSSSSYFDTSSYCDGGKIYVNAASEIINSSKNNEETCAKNCMNDENCEMYLMPDSNTCITYKNVSNISMFCEAGGNHQFWGKVKNSVADNIIKYPPTEPVPTPTEPVPTPTEPVPTPIEPVPTPTEPLPTPIEPVPTPTEPVPTPIEPVPTPIEPVPTPTEPVPTPTEPTLATTAPAPAPSSSFMGSGILPVSQLISPDTSESISPEQDKSGSDEFRPIQPTIIQGLEPDKVAGNPVYYEPGTVKYKGLGYSPSYSEMIYLNNHVYKSTPKTINQSLVKGFCNESDNIMNKIDEKCSLLEPDVCASTECCVLFGGQKCVEGDNNGPKNKMVYSDTTIKNRDLYYYQGDCYGNCPPNNRRANLKQVYEDMYEENDENK